MRKGFTFVELLISAAIFASVLSAAFISLSTVLRSIRNSESTRTVAASGFDAVSTIALYARYASPVYGPNHTRLCQTNGSNSLKLAAAEGLYEETSSKIIYLSVPATQPPEVYKIYAIAAQPAHYDATGQAIDYNLTLSEYETTPIKPTEPDCGFRSINSWPLLADNTFVQPLTPTEPLFEIEATPPKSIGSIGDISFDPATVGEPNARRLLIKFKVIERDADSNAVTQSRSFQTTIVPRLYQSTYSSL
ncbi:MAG: prepilin-type N-terminal cleavage/methylation domain-containing protein [bacterium]|nr:prepilin-type N-terminal cleavage/methylation domain-containing protein [bacterium]